MDSVLAFAVIFAVFAIGDVIANKTKAIVSMLFFASIAFLLSFWGGVPKTLFKDSNILFIAPTLIVIMITHMGTIMSFKELLRQWKTVVLGFVVVIGIGAAVYFIGTPLMGRENALAGAPVVAGGVVASILMSTAAKAAGFETAAIFATLVVATQSFIGYPVASLCLKKEAKRISRLHAEGRLTAADGAVSPGDGAKSKLSFIPPLPVGMQTPAMLIAKVALVAVLAGLLEKATGGALNKVIIALILGIVFKEIGFLEENILTKANAFGLVVSMTSVLIFSNLASATPQIVLSLLWPLACALGLGVVAIALISIPLGKLLKLSPYMAIAIGSTALFGFPGTYILSNEVATAESTNEAQKKAILDGILPKMLVAGFVTITTCSVMLASYMAKLF
jgi:hypothetical protein